MKITLKGKYRSKAVINLFGWRIALWSKTGNINEAVVLTDQDAWLFAIPGPFDVRVDLHRTGIGATLILDGTPLELFTYAIPLPSPVVEFPIAREWNGNSIGAVIRVEA